MKMEIKNQQSLSAAHTLPISENSIPGTKEKFWTRLRMFMLALLLIGLTGQGCDDDDDIDPLNSDAYIGLNQDMRNLWSEHMAWTLATVEAFFHHNNALTDNLNRLLQNQEDIGAAIVPYYGQVAGDQLTELLTEHINLAVPVLTAAQNGDETALGIAVTNWKNNAQDIAEFLTAANPNHWPASVTEPTMEEHIDQTIDYSVKILENNHAAANVAYDHALAHMMTLADILSEGIAKQFPDKF
ncbi:MAG TPA: hypothetical protein VGK46_06320 [Saprospiraceae bacterium]